MSLLSTPFKTKEALHDDLIPEGTYPATVLASSVRIGNDGAEEIITLLMELAMPSGERRTTIEWIRINAPSEVAKRIARKNLADLLTSLGIEELTNVEDLIGKALSVRATVRASEGYRPLNNYTFLLPVRQAA